MRIQQFLAQLGYGSRRSMEEKIRQGQVEINGRVAVLGDCVEAGDALRVDGALVEMLAPRPRMLIYYKPPGEICSHQDDLGKGTCFDRLPPLERGRWQSVGRLDAATTGLLLCTTYGPWVDYLTYPGSGFERRYWVKVEGPLSRERLERLRLGIKLEDGPASIVHYRYPGASDQECEVVVAEGRNRLVRRLFERIGCPVKKLKRLKYGPFELPRRLRPGQYMEISEESLERFARAAQVAHRDQKKSRLQQGEHCAE